MNAKQKQSHTASVERAPVVAVMGHIDHGKSSLLDYIRESNVVAREAGGITQHIAAYEVTHKNEDGQDKKITFIDTPGHEAFGAMRKRSAELSDVVILIVSAEDGPKPQTVESYEAIKAAGVPFVIAINKVDRPNANPEKVKADLLEYGIYVEGMGGDIPFVLISAKTGEGIPDLLSTILLLAEMEELTYDNTVPATGAVIETNRDPKKGISATLILKNGTLAQGQFVVSGSASAPVRIMENYLGKKIATASAASPVRITGWSDVPDVGHVFHTVDTRKEAEALVQEYIEANQKKASAPIEDGVPVLPIILKTDVAGSHEAVLHEIAKLPTDRLRIMIVDHGIGNIGEADIKRAAGTEGTLVVGFNVGVDGIAERLAEQLEITTKTFSIIYELADWLTSIQEERTPRETVEEVVGRARILRCFSNTKGKQVVGGKIMEGTLRVKSTVRIVRRDNPIGTGEIVGLQQAKTEVTELHDAGEFGTMIESKLDIAEGDIIEVIEKVVR